MRLELEVEIDGLDFTTRKGLGIRILDEGLVYNETEVNFWPMLMEKFQEVRRSDEWVRQLKTLAADSIKDGK